STNVIDRPLVSVITGVALDHTEILGPTRVDIAREKAGILRAGVPAVLGAVDDEAFEVVVNESLRLARPPPLYRLGRDFFPYEGSLGLTGKHQRDNATVALQATSLLPGSLRPTKEAQAEGLLHARWPGRLERVTHPQFPRVPIWLDGAHNVDGATALAQH